jgi:hypothetical protein
MDAQPDHLLTMIEAVERLQQALIGAGLVDGAVAIAVPSGRRLYMSDIQRLQCVVRASPNYYYLCMGQDVVQAEGSNDIKIAGVKFTSC